MVGGVGGGVGGWGGYGGCHGRAGKRRYGALGHKSDASISAGMQHSGMQASPCRPRGGHPSQPTSQPCEPCQPCQASHHSIWVAGEEGSSIQCLSCVVPQPGSLGDGRRGVGAIAPHVPRRPHRHRACRHGWPGGGHACGDIQPAPAKQQKAVGQGAARLLCGWRGAARRGSRRGDSSMQVPEPHPQHSTHLCSST
jgi:hypothetical protein